MTHPQMPWWALPGLAAMIILTFDGTLIGVFVKGDPNLLIAMAQAVIQLAMLTLGYYFGSSAGSQKKDDTIAQKLNSATPDQPPMAIAISGANPEEKP